jgi:ABC-type Fe3+ transport system substrate-binding protein
MNPRASTRSMLRLALAGWLLVAIACGPAAGGGAAGSAASAPAAQRQNAPAAPTAAPSLSPELQAIVDGARREGELSLVWGENSVGGRKAIEPWNEGLNRRYGLNVKVQFTPGPSIPELFNTITQERQAGRRSATDLFLGTEAFIAAALQGNLLQPTDWASWAPNVTNPDVLAPDGTAVKINSELPGITYNTARFTESTVPRSMQDLLKPEYKGRLATTPVAASFDRLASPEVWGEQRTTDYVQKLADQVGGLIRPGELERIASGEFELFALNTNSSDAALWRAKGAPIDQVIATDAPLLQYKYLGIPVHATHPSAARLFLDYILSREAQEILWETGFTDLHVLPGSQTAGPIEQAKANGLRFVELDVAFVQRHDEAAMRQMQARFTQILQKR